MKRAITLGAQRPRGFDPPLPRRALGLAVLAVAAISFTIGLLR